jgi:hypothetical protein
MQMNPITRRGTFYVAALTTLLTFANAQSPAVFSKGNYLNFGTGDKSVPFVLEKDFVPMGLSANSRVSGTVVFAGYGISAPEFRYDDYESIDAKGKIVVVLEHEPQENDEKSIFAGTRLTSHAEVSTKAINAVKHGAVGMILVNDPGNHAGHAAATLEKAEDLGSATRVSIPVIYMTAAAADQILSAAGKSSEGLRREIDKDLKTQSFAVDGSRHIDLSVNN